jgi:hypothetical protein
VRRTAPVLLLAALAVLAGPLGAQTAAPDSGRFRITPLIAPAYNPEMQFLIAGGVLISWKSGRNPLRVQRSTLSSTISYSTTGAANVANNLTGFFAEDRLQVTAGLSFKNMPDNYWGVGYDNGLSPESGDSTTKYLREWWQARLRAVWEVRPDLYLGGNVDVNHTIATDPGPRMTADSTYRAQGSSIFNTGIGAVVQYDTRDVANNAWRGTYASLGVTKYGRTLGGNSNYAIYLWDYRHYTPLGRNGRTLAFQLKARLTGGTVPWPELSMVGSGSDVRGYVEGRFRDREALIGLVEYRHMFVRSSGRLSRHGFVTWVGGGALGPTLSFEGFLPNAGAGYRFELQPRANVRVDVGVGRRSTGVYFNFTEAF